MPLGDEYRKKRKALAHKLETFLGSTNLFEVRERDHEDTEGVHAHTAASM
jgi:hypothetical protein